MEMIDAHAIRVTHCMMAPTARLQVTLTAMV